MLTKKGFLNLMERIMNSGGMTDDMEEAVRKIKDDYEEREGVLRKYGEEWDDENEEFEYQEKYNMDDVTRVVEENERLSLENETLKKDYDDLKARYTKNFLHDIKQDDIGDDDSKKTPKDLQIDDLFE